MRKKIPKERNTVQLSIDFETRSTTDLPKAGVYRYSQDPNTDVWCMAFAFEDDEEPQLWVPGDPVTAELRFAESFRAWNAQFERTIWREICVKRYGFPAIDRDQFYCTQAEAAAMALPLGLGKCATVLRVDDKDDAGHRLMLRMAKPRKPRKNEDPNALLWWDDGGRRARLYDYCKQDVVVEKAIAKKLRRLPKRERRAYLLDQKINDRGVRVDMELALAMHEMAEEAVARANVTLHELTDGACSEITNTSKLRSYLAMESVTKQAVAEELALEPEGTRRDVLQLRADNGKSSVSKLASMFRVHILGKLHGLLQYHGASTGRWAGRLVQPQNFPRPMKNVERFIDRVRLGDYDAVAEEAPVMEVLASMLRSLLIPDKDSSFMCADFSAIEGWVVAWLAGQEGMTSYEEMAARIFNVKVEDVTEEQRAVGKTAVLGCGFGMGWEKYQATVYDWTGIVISDELSQYAIDTYRTLNVQIKDLWYDLEKAAVRAVMHPGSKQTCGRGGCVTYRVKGPYLWCELPSQRLLCFPLPKIIDHLTPWGTNQPVVEISVTNSYTNKWERRHLYGGLQTENVVQAIARDVMLDAMFRVEDAGYETVLTVHDEVLTQAGEYQALESFEEIMSQPVGWAPGLVVKAKGWIGNRYRK